jgi:hypothetical protein
VVNVSSSCIHNFDTESKLIPTYGLTKNSAALLLQQIANDTDPAEMQIVSFHPGGVWTEMAASTGMPADLYDWDDENLAGQFAVWAASEEAKFLHGHFVGAHWDVDELKEKTAKKIAEASSYLKIGVLGLQGDAKS